MGYVTEGVEFIATGITPTVWTNTTEVTFETGEAVVTFNDVDSNLDIYFDLSANGVTPTSGKLVFKITNNKFLEEKTYPSLESSQATIENNNTISFTGSQGYFKIEVYN